MKIIKIIIAEAHHFTQCLQRFLCESCVLARGSVINFGMARKGSWFPREPGDRISFVFMLVVVHMVALYELFVILPYIDGDRTSTFWLHACLGFYIYFNVMTSFLKLLTTDSSTAGEILPTLLLPGWRYCSQCETNSPPRFAINIIQKMTYN